MRLLLAAAAVALPLTALTGCGTEGSAPTSAATTSPEHLTKVEAYAVLVRQTDRFFAAASAAEKTNPDADPQSAEELLALVDYTFTEGVTLAKYDEEHLCFTGPGSTYLSLFERKDDLRRLLGTGECTYDGGDVVLEVVFDEGAGLHLEQRVLEGADIAEQIPGLDDFVDTVNEAFAATGVPEGDPTSDPASGGAGG